MTTVKQQKIPEGTKFLIGGLSGMAATCCVQPLDLVKTRMQVSGAAGGKRVYNNSIHAFTSIVAKDGVFALYTGLTAGLLRQATYSTCRLGTYTSLYDYFSRRLGTDPPLLTKIGIAVTAGVCGAAVGNPAELCLIRMTADGLLPPTERRGYANVFNALFRIVREEGLATLWRGCIPTMGRAAVVNAAQLASYSQAKQQILATGKLQDGIGVHFIASLTSGFITSVTSLPIDMAKTRIQNMKSIDGSPEYRNMFDVLIRVVRQEGIPALWKGFSTYFPRIGGHTILMFVFLEQMNKAYRQLFLDAKA